MVRCEDVPAALVLVGVVVLPLLAGSEFRAEAARKLAAATRRRSTWLRFHVCVFVQQIWTASRAIAGGAHAPPSVGESPQVIPPAFYRMRLLLILLTVGAALLLAWVLARHHGKDGRQAPLESAARARTAQEGRCRGREHGESVQREWALALCLSQVRHAQTQSAIPELDANILRYITELTTEAEHTQVAARVHDRRSSRSSLLVHPHSILVVLTALVGVVPVACCGAVALALECVEAKFGRAGAPL